MAFWVCQLAQQQHLQQQWQALQSQLHSGMEGSWSQFGPQAAFSRHVQGLYRLYDNPSECSWRRFCCTCPICLFPQYLFRALALNLKLVWRKFVRLLPPPFWLPMFQWSPLIFLRQKCFANLVGDAPGWIVGMFTQMDGTLIRRMCLIHCLLLSWPMHRRCRHLAFAWMLLIVVRIPCQKRCMRCCGRLMSLGHGVSPWLANLVIWNTLGLVYLCISFTPYTHACKCLWMILLASSLSFAFRAFLLVNLPSCRPQGSFKLSWAQCKALGNLQVYPGAMGRSGGNARLNCGQLGQVRAVRSALLRSQWFWPAGPNSSTPLDACGKLVQMADGRLALPPISPSTKVTDLKSLFQDIAKRAWCCR